MSIIVILAIFYIFTLKIINVLYVIDENVAKFASSLFKRYYSKNRIGVDSVANREFGFGDFESKISYRHREFKTDAELQKYMVEQAPAFVSYSASFYSMPAGRPMENKGWLGAELVFDLDATDLHLECQKAHGSSWVCENCFSSIKDETIKLIEDFLMPDFGFSEKEIRINFSGNRGYHIRIKSDDIFGLGSDERKQISDYISGSGIKMENFFPTINQRNTKLEGPRPTDYGWGGKMAKGMIELINGGEGKMAAMGIKKADVQMLLKNKQEIITGINNGNWDMVRISKKAEFWRGIVEKMTIKQSDSIDRNVTKDVYHLLRAPNTLHGDTGLVAKRLGSLHSLQVFEPMKDGIVFGDRHVRVHAGKVSAFYMKGEQFGPYNDQDAEMPLYAALYLMLKRVATLAEV